MKIDFEFLALVICSVFGWTLDDVFNLNWAQFCYISSEVRHIQYMRGKNETFYSICAALGEKKTRDIFLKSAEEFIIKNDQPENPDYTEEDLRAAEKRMRDWVKPDFETGKEKSENV